MRPDKKPRSSPVHNPAGAVNQFRKYAKYIVLTVMFGMLIISFGLWGIGDMLRSGGSSTEIAHVGGTHIPIYGWVGGSSVTANQVRDQFNLQLDNI
jgi:peptidyl-prolyl cis-trans isomerase D